MEWQPTLPEETLLIQSATLVIQVAPSVLEGLTKNALDATKAITFKDRAVILGANCRVTANASRSRCRAVLGIARNTLSM